MRKFYKRTALLAALGALVAMVQTASAVPVTVSSIVVNGTGPTSPDITFSAVIASGGSIPGGTLTYTSGTLFMVPPPNTSEGAQPFPLTQGNYLSVTAGDSATFSFDSTRTTFGLMWGSVDAYNKIQFRLNGSDTESFDGDDIIPGNNGNQDLGGSAYVTFTGDYDEVILTSSENSFEVDNIISVPDGGSTLALLGGVLVMVGAVSRRFRK